MRKSDAWTGVSTGLEQIGCNPEDAARDATLFALANGALGVRGAIDELPGLHASFLASAYMRRPIKYHERFPGYADGSDTRLTGPAITRMLVQIDGTAIDFADARMTKFERHLSFASGTLGRTTTWQLIDGRTIEIMAERLVPDGHDAMCAARIQIRLIDFAGTVRLDFPLLAPDNDGADVNDPRIASRAHVQLVKSSTAAGRVHARFGTSFDSRPVIDVAQALGGAAHPDHVTRELATGEWLVVDRFVAMAVSDEDAAIRRLESATNLGFDRLVLEQQRACERYWDRAAIAVNGAPDLGRALQFNLFHLFQSASRDPDIGVAAKGLTGEGYEGHYFWDSEVFVLPVLAFTAPHLARNVITYRIATLDKAKAHASAIGHRRGALFPWRTISGWESSAHYPTGSAQYHINAAIAYAVETYVLVTGDIAILAEGAAELVFETARLWLDIGHFSERRGGAFLIHGVTGPDEYSALVDNDLYTNAMARRHLRFAVYVAQEHGGVEAREIADWSRAAEAMWLPVDAALGVHPQDDAFLDKPLFRDTRNGGDAVPLLLSLHPMQLFRHRLCKQGDVLQAYATGALIASQAQMRRDFAYYEPLTTHDSTLSATAFAIVAARAGLAGAGKSYLAETAFVDLEDRHHNTAHGAHMAAMAGSWLSLVQGWAGLTIGPDRLSFAPTCPDAWNGYQFRLCAHGSTMEVAVDPDGTDYRLIDGPDCTVFDRGRPVRVSASPVYLPKPAIDAVIFDLDGVLTDTAEAHYSAWRRLCDVESIPFDRALNERLKGIDRAGSLRIILEAAGHALDEARFAEWMERKNSYYRASIASFTPSDLFPGVRTLLESCLCAGLRLGVASASRNAAELLDRLGIATLFDHVADAAAIPLGKPYPDIFLATAAAIGVDPLRCVGVEDAAAGIAAIRAAGMRAIGVGTSEQLSDADDIVAKTGMLTVQRLIEAADGNQKTEKNHYASRELES